MIANRLTFERRALLEWDSWTAPAKAYLNAKDEQFDVGPVIERAGLERIFDYVGRNPAARTHEALAERLPAAMPGFTNVPDGRWLADAQKHYDETPEGLRIKYDPALREAFLAAFEGAAPDLWPLWDATAGLPVALIRGASSDLLSATVAAEMLRRRPDTIFASVPNRAHIPWLDEPESLAAITAWRRLDWASL